MTKKVDADHDIPKVRPFDFLAFITVLVRSPVLRIRIRTDPLSFWSVGSGSALGRDPDPNPGGPQ
jgi:hypothetical protein